MKIFLRYFIFIFFVLAAFGVSAIALWQSSWHQSGPAEAAGFGISPPYFQHLSLRPGDEFSQTITIMRTGPARNRVVRLDVDAPDLAGWLVISPGEEFIFWEGEDRTEIVVSAQVPATAAPGVYKGFIAAVIAPEFGSGAAIAVGARINVELHVLGLANAAVPAAYKQMDDLLPLVHDASSMELYHRLAGRFIIRPQHQGELYYIDPALPQVHYLPDSQAAWRILADLSLGVNDQDLSRLPAAPVRADEAENAWARALSGRLLLQAESAGQLWYVFPQDLHRYALPCPRDAFILAQLLSIGISEEDFAELTKK